MPNKSLSRLQEFDQRIAYQNLDNGVRLIHIPYSDDPRFLIAVTIQAGARYEGDCHGVAHLLEHLMFRGSRRYPSFRELAKAFESIGGEWNASTGYEHTDYYYSGHLRYQKQAIKLFADFFMNPRLQDIEIERDVIQKELQRELNEKNINTDLYYQMNHLLWPKSNIDRQILGTKKSIQQIKKAHLEKYRRQFYHSENIVVCAVGGTDTEQTFARLSAEFSGYKLKAKDQSVNKAIRRKLRGKKGPLTRWLYNADSEYQLQWSFRGPSETDSEAIHCSLLCRILSEGYFSKLGSRLRETLGLVYAIDAEPNLMTTHGTLDIHSAVAAEDLPKFIKELWQILRRLAKKGPSKADLYLAKKRALIDLELSSVEPEAIYMRYSWAVLRNKKASLVKSAEKISAVTDEQMKSFCNKIFEPSRLAVVFLGPTNSELQKICDPLVKGTSN